MSNNNSGDLEKVPFALADIAAAERIAGVEYSDAERALMADNLASQIDLSRRRRKVPLPEDLAPALVFDPRLPGWRAPKAGAFRPASAFAVPLPDDRESIAFAPLVHLAAWIRAGKLTSRRLTEIYLERIARIGPVLECITASTAELALQQADRADSLLAAERWLGPLHGIPWGCKDLIDTAGIETAWGAEPYRGRTPQKDATVVRKLAEAGAVLVAKTTVGALAYGDIWYGGVTRNPWNTAEGSSGSSAGSAAGVAAGLFAFAIGTETLGSIVSPSVRCGATGLRPTFGRVSRAGAMPLCWSLDKIGPLARTVEDTALVLSAIGGSDPDDPASIDVPLSYDGEASVAGLRIGFFDADFAASPEQALDRAALSALQAVGATLVPLTRRDLPYDTLMNTLLAEAAASFEALTLDNRDDELVWQETGAWPNTFRKARFLSAVDHVQLDRLRRLVMQATDAMFGEVDAVVGPAMSPMLIISNFTGHPCLTLRSGFIQSPTRGELSLARARIDQSVTAGGDTNTVPHGICVWGKLFDEGMVLTIGRALERSFAVWDRRPSLS